MNWEREMDEAIAAQGGANILEELDGALSDAPTPETNMGVVVGSITFAPDQSNPKHCPFCVAMQQELERLRIGNAALLHDNRRLQRALEERT